MVSRGTTAVPAVVIAGLPAMSPSATVIDQVGFTTMIVTGLGLSSSTMVVVRP